MNAWLKLELSAGLIVLAAVTIPGTALSQSAREALEIRERQVVARIAAEESANGPYSERLVGPLTTLSLLYEEMGEFALVDASIQRVIQVIRADYGLYSLEQAPSIRRLIELEDSRGNAQAAWDLEQELLGIAERHRDDIRTVAILRDTGNRRFETLRRYIAGEFPPEIVLGCYYDESYAYLKAWTRGSRPLTSLPGGDSLVSCTSGSRVQAKQALFGEAQSLYAEAANIILRNELYSSEELKELLTTLVESSHRYGNPALGRHSLRYLLAYETTNTGEWLPRIEALVRLADWNLLYSNSGNGTKAALAAYRQAYDLAQAHGLSRETIEDIFTPDMPVLLPSFVANPLATDEASEQSTYIDCAFVVTKKGKSDDIEIIDTGGNVTRTARKDLVKLLKRGRFRPRLVDGQFADSPRMVVRYYPNG